MINKNSEEKIKEFWLHLEAIEKINNMPPKTYIDIKITPEDFRFLLTELKNLKEKLTNLIQFAKEVIEVSFDGGTLDGGKIQNLGMKYGLLIEEPYDPKKHGEELLEMMEPGDLIYVYSDVFKSINTNKDNEGENKNE